MPSSASLHVGQPVVGKQWNSRAYTTKRGVLLELGEHVSVVKWDDDTRDTWLTPTSWLRPCVDGHADAGV